MALVLAALALSGCESTQEESAKLEKTAKREQAKHPRLAQKGLSITRASRQVSVLDATLVSDSEGAAAAVTVRNVSSRALKEVPIAITVKSRNGQILYQNNAPGLEAALTQVSSLPAHGTATWVDDQIPTAGQPVSVSAIVGESPALNGLEPRIEVGGLHLSEETTGEASGTVRNRSQVSQQKLVVYVVARRAGKIAAAGRAVLAEVAAGASVPFQAFLVGTTAGAKLEASAPPTTFG